MEGTVNEEDHHIINNGAMEVRTDIVRVGVTREN